jgi:outer membrane protein TolC
MSLQEAIAISLENGTTGIQNIDQLGRVPDDLLTLLQLRQIEFASDSIRVLSMEPAISSAAIEASLAKFDVKWVSQMLWSHADQQPNGILNTTTNGDNARLETSLVKPLPTGGLADITFSTAYQNLTTPSSLGTGVINPSYAPRLDFVFEQPLWRDFGVAINQLLNRWPGVSPGSNLSGAAQQFLGSSPANSQQGNSAGFGSDGILIARLRFDQSRAEFERTVNYMLVNVEAAYWNLYSAYVNLYAADQGVRLARVVWARYKAMRESGGGAGKDQGFKPYFEDRARGQYELFVGDRVQAVGQVLEAERLLRALLGITADDGKQLIPIDAPTLAPYLPDWGSALEECMNLRPELIGMREEVKLRQFDMELQKNFLKPDLRFVSRYGINALGNTLSGDGVITDPTTGSSFPANAFRGLSSSHFSDWNVGLTFNVPLGFKFEHASVRRARLSLAQAYWATKNEERKAQSFLTKAYRDVFDQYHQLKHRRAQRAAFGAALKTNLELAEGGVLPLGDESLLQTQRDYVGALRQEAQTIAAYNTSLATFQFAKGTLMQHDNVSISEGALPVCAQERAVVHEQERSAALFLRERALCLQQSRPDNGYLGVTVPEIPSYAAPALPALVDDPSALMKEASAKAPLLDDEPIAMPPAFNQSVTPKTTPLSSPKLPAATVPSQLMGNPSDGAAVVPTQSQVLLPMSDIGSPPAAWPGQSSKLTPTTSGEMRTITPGATMTPPVVGRSQ